jgi:hypothetical protein
MNKILAVLVVTISLMGCVAALDAQSGVGMRPGETAFENLFNQGIGQPWIGGNLPGFQGEGQGISTGTSGDIFPKYSQFGQSGTDMRPGETAFEHLFNQGIGQPWIGGNPPGFQGEDQGISTGTSGDIFSKYSQFFSLSKGNDHRTHIEAPTKYDINKFPTTVYFSNQMQAVPYSQYQTYSTNTGGNSLWIQGSASWSQYATVPQGAGLSLLATTSSGGSGYLYEITPDGQLTKNYYNFFPGSNQINFYADIVGQHILLFAIGDQVSSAVVIDVAGNQPPIY